MKQIIGDFGKKDDLGAWYNPASWFSDETKFTKEQNIAAGEAWLKQVYNEARPSYTYAKMVEQLKTTHYGTVITDEDYKDFLDTIGFAVNTKKEIADKVRASLVKTILLNKTKFPDRRQFSSAFLNPDNIKWTMLDAISQVAKEGATQVQSIAQDVATVSNMAFSTLGGILKFRWWIIGAAAIGAGYFIYKNREEVVGRLKERTLQKIGMAKKSNPKKSKFKRSRKKV